MLQKQVRPRDAGGPPAARHSHCRQTKMPVDERPVPCHVDQIGRHQREHHRRHDSHGLQVAAQNEVEREGQRAPHQRFQEWDGLRHQSGRQPKIGKQRQEHQDESHQQRRQRTYQVQRVPHCAMTLLQFAGAIGLSYQRVHTEHGAAPEYTDGVEQRRSQTRGPYGRGTVGKAADHHGIGESHGQPAQLREGQRSRQTQHRPELLPNSIGTQHGIDCNYRGEAEKFDSAGPGTGPGCQRLPRLCKGQKKIFLFETFLPFSSLTIGESAGGRRGRAGSFFPENLAICLSLGSDFFAAGLRPRRTS